VAATIYERVGRLREALQHYKAFKRLDDEGRALAASTEAALLSAQFDFADQRAKIASLQADAQMKEAAMAKREARSTLLLGAVIVLGGILVIGLMLQALVSLRRSGARLSALNDELSTSNIALEKALNARTEFLAMTSHEIRTPLNGILGMTQVMLAEPEAQGELRNRLEIIRASGVTMNALLTDLLDIAKIEKGHVTIERSEIDLPAMIGAMAPIWSEKAAQQGLSFELDLTRCPDRIVEDAAMLRQILSNLLANAVKFTPEGSVFMGLATRQTREGERLIITVSDSGIGIPQDQFDRVFEAFTQVDGGTSRHYGGTGLGLAICKNLARSLGGEISVESVVGAGSTFTVDLPLTRALPVGHEGEDSEGDLSRAFVLGVEDNPLSQALLRSALKGKVRGLEFAARPEEALSERALAPDLLVVDGACLQRHHPQDPFAPIQRLRRSFRAPMVVLWPSMTPADSARLKSLGVERVLAKPVMAAALNAALEQAYVQSLAPPRQNAVVG
jgi:signal transduction histidine kinase/CheY-like chemotaxis protein